MSADQVFDQLYRRYMDPALLYLPVGGFVRHGFARLMANLRQGHVAKQYEMIGGRSPLVPLSSEQARDLRSRLQTRSACDGVDIRAYTAHRYGPNRFEDVARQMKADDVDKVILLPMSAQYAQQRAASWLRYWNVLVETGEISDWPRTAVHEFAAHPGYVQAISERIDEGMQRFSAAQRPDIHLLFTAEGQPLSDADRQRDPSCCLTTATVEQVMRHRRETQPFSIAYQSPVGPSQHAQPSVNEAVARLGEAGTAAVLVVPVTFLTDRIETDVDLDINLREKAEMAGVEAFEVTRGLNSHPLLIDALADAVLAQCRTRTSEPIVPTSLPGNERGDGSTGIASSVSPQSLEPYHPAELTMSTCPACQQPRAHPMSWRFSDPATSLEPAIRPMIPADALKPEALQVEEHA